MSMKEGRQNGAQDAQTLYERLVQYGQGDFYPCHMPGHKRSRKAGVMSDFFAVDITEIDGFDNLHQAQGILKQAQERAAALYDSEETFFLVNGSTCGILAAVSTAADRGDTLLIARNCHKSVYHAALLQELSLHYLYPEWISEYDIAGAVNPADVADALDSYPECRAVVITSPTYEGILSDIREISRIVHEKGRILIVDEAHGAHLGLAEGIPENAVRLGADIVIHSLHKTLPSMTQTALLHVNGGYVNRAKLRKYLSIYQSSSPSYVLMASIDACISYMQKNAAACFDRMGRYYRHFIKRMDGCRNIRVGSPKTVAKTQYCFSAWDIGKLVISVKSVKSERINGQWLYDMLREKYHLQMEMAADSYVLAMMTIADEEEGWQRLADALLQIDVRIEEGEKDSKTAARGYFPIRPDIKMTIAEAFCCVQKGNSAADGKAPAGRAYPAGGREIPLAQAAGKAAGDFVNLYPPGIPLLVPGEIIDADSIRQIQEYQRLGLRVQGVSEEGTVIIC